MSGAYTVGMTEGQYQLLTAAIETAIEDLNDKIYEREDDYSDEDREGMEERLRELEEAGDWLKIATGHAYDFQDNWEIVRDSTGDPVEIDYPAGQEIKPDALAHVWTVLDCEGKLYVSPGFHWVNRQMHIMTVKPWTADDEQKEWIY